MKIACSGAGAAAIACLDQLVSLGVRMENILVTDAKGVVYEGRPEGMDPIKARYARPTSARTLGDIVEGADIFLGLSAGGVLKPDMVKRMAKDPLILALANPTPEILPEEAKAVRPDAIIATGRSDYPNQVNNVLCFPFLFRGALDVGATTINEAMKSAAVRAIASLAHAEVSDVVATAYGDQRLQFGPDYLIPTPFDPRLIERIAPAVAKAAMESGVASRPLADLEAYRQTMARFMYHSGASMEPVFAAAKVAQKRIALAEGEDDRVLRAAQLIVDESLGRPVLVGRPDVACSPTCAAPSYRGMYDGQSHRRQGPRHRRLQRCADHRSAGEAGRSIKAEQSLITLESDKASMEVPSPVDGVVKEIKVKLGDKVSEGTLILTAEAEAAPAGVAPRRR